MLYMQVNGEDLAGVLGGEVTHTNYHSGRGDPFVIILEFTKPKDMDASGISNYCFLRIIAVGKEEYVLESTG